MPGSSGRHADTHYEQTFHPQLSEHVLLYFDSVPCRLDVDSYKLWHSVCHLYVLCHLHSSRLSHLPPWIYGHNLPQPS